MASRRPGDSIDKHRGNVVKSGKRTELRDVDTVATRGGFVSTVGITCPGAVRCEIVMEPSEFGHIMTIAEFAILLPKPL